MADQDGTLDSRTSLVSRKRTFADSNENVEVVEESNSGDEAEEMSRKRTRTRRQISISNGPTITERIPPPPTQPSASTSIQSGGWNKGVKATGNIRTTLGSRKPSSMAQFGSVPDANAVQHVDTPVHMDEEDQQKLSNTAQVIDHSAQAKDYNSPVNFEPSIRDSRSTLPASQAAVGVSGSNMQDQGIISTSATEKSRRKRNKKKTELDAASEPKMSKRAAKRLKQQLEEDEAHAIREQHHTETIKLLENSDLADDRKAVLLSLDPAKITKASLRLFNGLSPGEKLCLPATTMLTFATERDKRAEQSRMARATLGNNQAMESGLVLQDNVVDALHDGKSVDSSPMEISGAENDVGEIIIDELHPEAPGNILAAMSELELELQLKYFPTSDGAVSVPRCLACSESDHATVNCPFISCQTCGQEADHVASACPRKQRCGRCRGLGHATVHCPERLARVGSEAVPCDLCHKLDHIESSCQMIWRSYSPPLKNLKLIKSLPMDCYMCGQSGHVGPECGIYQGQGNPTFSRGNFMRYVNSSGSNRAVGTGKDYTIPPKKKSTFNIKGMASDPINLDDSEDEMQGFIHTKIKPPTSKGNIQVGNIASTTSRPDRGQDNRAGFGSDRYAPVMPVRKAVESYRYDRERSFSPPPRYDQRSDFAPLHDRGPGGAFQDFNQPPPLPRGPPPPSVRGGRSGRGGGSSRGGVSSRGRPANKPPGKAGGNPGGHKKPKAKRGGKS